IPASAFRSGHQLGIAGEDRTGAECPWRAHRIPSGGAPTTVAVPPERVSPFDVTAGEMLPSGLRLSVASRLTHEPGTRLRTGTAAGTRVSVPFGWAVRVPVAVVAPDPSTPLPVALARASA